METPSVVEYSIDAQIDVFDTEAFAENEVDAACEYAHTCNLGCHGRTHFQRDCNFTECRPSFPVDPFDHNTTSASAIVFEASITETSYRLPYCGLTTSVDDNVFVRPCAPKLAQWSASR